MNKRNAKKEARKERLKTQKQKRGRRKENEKAWKEHFQAFQEELAKKGLYMREIDGDGNCLFRSFSDQFHGVETRHKDFRFLAVNYMRINPDNFKPFIDEDEITWDEYLATMSKDSEWGDHFELQALSQHFKINIVIHMRGGPPMLLMNFPKKNRTIHLAYHLGENFGEHYSSVRKLGDDAFEEAVPIDLDKVLEKNDKAPEGEEERLAEEMKRLEIRDEDDEERKYHKSKGKKKKNDDPKPKAKPVVVQQEPEEEEHVNKNSKCPCGSGKKYKNCCFHKKKPATKNNKGKTNDGAKDNKDSDDDDDAPKVVKTAIFI